VGTWVPNWVPNNHFDPFTILTHGGVPNISEKTLADDKTPMNSSFDICDPFLKKLAYEL